MGRVRVRVREGREVCGIVRLKIRCNAVTMVIIPKTGKERRMKAMGMSQVS
jgi:hypothetical protein